jgi:cephalosporin hydroxylase
MNLWQDFKTNNGKAINKWMHYFPVYEKIFSSWRNKNITLLEVGVSKGGSLQMWQRFFGPMATIVGIDNDPACANHAAEDISVRIGDQSDVKFLQELQNEFGQFDIVIDDGSHHMYHVAQTFNFLYPRISKNGLYIVEDLHTAYWSEYGGGINVPSTFVNISKNFVDNLNAHHSRNEKLPDFITDNTFCISFYDSMIVYERGKIPIRQPIIIGN